MLYILLWRPRQDKVSKYLNLNNTYMHIHWKRRTNFDSMTVILARYLIPYHNSIQRPCWLCHVCGRIQCDHFQIRDLQYCVKINISYSLTIDDIMTKILETISDRKTLLCPIERGYTIQRPSNGKFTLLLNSCKTIRTVTQNKKLFFCIFQKTRVNVSLNVIQKDSTGISNG